MTNSNSATYSIEKGIPVVPWKQGRSTYPFANMQVGDSFALETSDVKEIDRVRSAASYFGIRHAPKKLAVRCANPITKAYRCWRIA